VRKGGERGLNFNQKNDVGGKRAISGFRKMLRLPEEKRVVLFFY
jgi:hypothetical protein